MPGGQVAACDYTPVGWPQGSYCIVRRVKVSASRISADPRSRRRRTIPRRAARAPAGGQADHAWACSFIVTNIPADDGADIVGLETWFRRRTSDALAVTRKRCWQQDWVVDERWVLLYIARWLTSPMRMPDGTLVARGKV